MPQYFEDSNLPFNPRKISVRLLGNILTFNVVSGLFSKDEIDRGSKVLIEHSVVPEEGSILDLGCGYGVVGVAVAKGHPKRSVLMTDVNPRAIRATKMNIAENAIENASARVADVYSGIDEKFDVILVNPPQAAGKSVCFEMIEGAVDHLKDGGSIQVVARRNFGGESIRKKMQEVFGSVDVLVKSGGFWIYRSIRTEKTQK
jgi:16S rRNA (guanine1207-N2)-methyltransferase